MGESKEVQIKSKMKRGSQGNTEFFFEGYHSRWNSFGTTDILEV